MPARTTEGACSRATERKERKRERGKEGKAYRSAAHTAAAWGVSLLRLREITRIEGVSSRATGRKPGYREKGGNSLP
jgi:hypothetical protein